MRGENTVVVTTMQRCWLALRKGSSVHESASSSDCAALCHRTEALGSHPLSADEGFFPDCRARKDEKRPILAQVCLRSARLSGKSACEGEEQPVWLCINKPIPSWNILMLGHRSLVFEEFPAVAVVTVHP